MLVLALVIALIITFVIVVIIMIVSISEFKVYPFLAIMRIATMRSTYIL